MAGGDEGPNAAGGQYSHHDREHGDAGPQRSLRTRHRGRCFPRVDRVPRLLSCRLGFLCPPRDDCHSFFDSECYATLVREVSGRAASPAAFSENIRRAINVVDREAETKPGQVQPSAD
jgi:hypothetical protein